MEHNGQIHHSNSYLISIALFTIFIAIITVYFLSETFRTNRALKNIKVYTDYLTLTSLDPKKLSNYKLGDFYISSSFNTACVGYQMFDYVSLEMISAKLKTGARFLHFQVFNSAYNAGSVPVISSGYRTGEWKLTPNQITFEDACQLIAYDAFTLNKNEGGVFNPNDPLIICLDLKTNNQLSTLNKMYKIIKKHWSKRLINPKYSFAKRNVAEIPMIELMGKIIIIASNGYQGSDLEEFVNMNYEDRVVYTNTDAKTILTEIHTKKETPELIMVFPHHEGDIQTVNYDPQICWDEGAHCVCMNFQTPDEYMDDYITKFRNSSFILKSPHLR